MSTANIEELWDKFSEHIDDDLFSLEQVAGTSIIKREDFIKAMKEYGDQRAIEMRDKTIDLLSRHILDDGFWKELFETKILSFHVHPSLQP